MSAETLGDTTTKILNNIREKGEDSPFQLNLTPVEGVYCIARAADELLGRPAWNEDGAIGVNNCNPQVVGKLLERQYPNDDGLANRALILGITIAQIVGNGSAEEYLKSGFKNGQLAGAKSGQGKLVKEFFTSED